MDRKYSALVGAVGLCGFLLGLVMGSQYFGVEMSENRNRVIQLKEQHLLSEQQGVEIIGLRAAHDIDQQALESLRKSVASLDKRLSDQQEELMLYEKLLKVGSSEEGLHLLNVSVEPGATPLIFAYSFVIRQQAVTLKTISVAYSVQVNGHEKGRASSYAAADLSRSEKPAVTRTKLKYFSVVEGELHLPEQFVPRNLVISAWLEKSPAKRSELKFDWPGAGE